jgi:predicted metal-dependent phosphoesterase TrpH
MARAELDGIVLTEHDAFWERDGLEALQRANPERRIYSGIELSALDGHVIAIGTRVLMPWSKTQPVDAVARAIAELGGCAIWVHPYQSPVRWQTPATACHAIEIFSTVTFGPRSVDATRLARTLGAHCVAGSDAHAIDHLGIAGVELDYLPDDEITLARMLRLGLARPFECRQSASSKGMV